MPNACFELLFWKFVKKQVQTTWCVYKYVFVKVSKVLCMGSCAQIFGGSNAERIHLLVQRLAAVMAVVAENPDAGSLQDLSELVMQELG